jgi:hypothetical protein
MFQAQNPRSIDSGSSRIWDNMKTSIYKIAAEKSVQNRFIIIKMASEEVN